MFVISILDVIKFCFTLTCNPFLKYPLTFCPLTILPGLPSISFDPVSDQNHLRCCLVSSHKQPRHYPNHGASHTKSLGFATDKTQHRNQTVSILDTSMCFYQYHKDVNDKTYIYPCLHKTTFNMCFCEHL